MVAIIDIKSKIAKSNNERILYAHIVRCQDGT